MTSVIIMAQGRQTRFKSLDYPKCLIEVGGERLIERTIRLVNHIHRQSLPTAIVPDKWMFGVEGATWTKTLADPGYCILDGLWQTRDLWSQDGRTVILLGDVCYSRACIEAIFSDERDCVFFGSSDLTSSTGELYALAFNGPAICVASSVKAITWSRYMAAAIDAMPCRRIAHKIAQPGHLRNLLWAISNTDRNPVEDDSHYRVIEDFTTDFDTDSDLEQIPELEAILKEERTC